MDLLDQFLPSHPPEATSEERHWSPYQQAVFAAAEDPSQNLIIRAVAGSGKSTTLRKTMLHTGGGSNLLLAFNKAIADALRGEVGPAGDVKTFNALGHGLIFRNRRSAELDARKVLTILKNIMGEGSQDYKDFGYTLSRAVGLMKNCAFGLHQSFDVNDVVQLIDSYQMDIPFDRLSEFASTAARAFVISNQQKESFDFDDQLYIPLLEGWTYPYYSNVFVDECQDLSPIQHLMLERMALAGSRIIAVGDEHQAIYGFRGALTNSMDLLQKKFSMKDLPLSISYRCARSIVASAQEQCPHIEARSEAPEGEVYSQWDREYASGAQIIDDPELFKPSQLVICRNNAPMFRAIFRHFRAKSPCRVLTNFLESFQGFIRGFKVNTTQELRVKLDEWYTREKEAAEKKGFRGRLAGLKDKYETTKLISQEFKVVEDMLHAVRRLGEGTSGPIFATVHKSKGLEADSVYILRPDCMPSPFASTDDARQQEQNLIYVAKTRAKTTLAFGISPEGF